MVCPYVRWSSVQIQEIIERSFIDFFQQIFFWGAATFLAPASPLGTETSTLVEKKVIQHKLLHRLCPSSFAQNVTLQKKKKSHPPVRLFTITLFKISSYPIPYFRNPCCNLLHIIDQILTPYFFSFSFLLSVPTDQDVSSMNTYFCLFCSLSYSQHLEQ